MSSQPTMLFDSQTAPYALQTYYGYVRAWRERIARENDNGDLTQAALQIPNVAKLQGGLSPSQKLIASYSRGKLTLKAMATFPINDNKHLASTANLWLPVQAYYALHGAGLAAMLSLGHNEPKDHRAFRAALSELAARFLPPPLNIQCTGGPQSLDYRFTVLNATPQAIIDYNSLSNPIYSGNLDCAIGKCLSTTRHRFLEEMFDKARHCNISDKRKRRNIPQAEKQTISKKLHATTLIDFLYRMRVRSNYDDPDIYLYAHSQVDDAARHYADLLFLTQAAFSALSVILLKKLGKSTFEQIEGQFS
ncbi:MAG: hypothetical protein EPN22_12370 [Nitrospirae bacterium]|nr:MAG: hypothetical protein EPN22_12370 [Nitrospirota bacterium]